MRRTLISSGALLLSINTLACGGPAGGGEGSTGAGSTGAEVPDASSGSSSAAEATGSGDSGSSGSGGSDSGSSGATTGSTSQGEGTGSDSSESGETDEPSRLPALELCDPTADPIWQVERGGEGTSSFTGYACTRGCEGLEACSVQSEGFSEVRFVVDGMGGALRWQLGDDLVFMHNGGTGTTYPAGELVERTLLEGHGVAMARWELGSSINGADMGWVSRRDASATDFAQLTARIASVIHWSEANLSTGRFGTAACSAGAYVTFAAQLWHGLDESLDYQLFVGGPPFADLGLACGSTRGPSGRCSTDPSSTCNDAEECNGGICSAYLNNPQAPLAEMVDSAHLTGNACENAIDSRAWAKSEVFDTEGDWELSHPVDFVMNMGPGPGDPQIGAFAHAWDVAESLSGAEVGWHQQPGSHCQAFSTESSWPFLAAGMGW